MILPKLIGGRLCLDFANTVGGRDPEIGAVLREKLTGYAELVEWSRHAGFLTAGEAELLQEAGTAHPRRAREVWQRALALREAFYRLVIAWQAGADATAADVEILNREWARARQGEALVERDGMFRVEVERQEMDVMIGAVARSAVQLLLDGDRTRVRMCEGEQCGWVFEDTSRNGRRRWCDMGDCGTLDKVRRFRARGRAE